MEPTLDIIAAITVPPTYRWDDGIPSVTYTSLVDDLASSRTVLSSGEVQYVGYAPYFTVLLSSTPSKTNMSERPTNAINESYIIREVNFGDYYNSETNIYGGGASNFVLGDQYFATHTYIMPGTYSIKYTQTIFDVVTSNDNNAIYKQQDISYDRVPFSWQWYNFRQNPNGSTSNLSATWTSTGFQKPNQLIWSKTAGKCVALNYINSNIVWQWDNIVNNTSSLTVKLCGAPLTWDNLRSDSPKGATWNFTKSFFRGDLLNISTNSSSYVVEKNLIIKILEVLPEAFLMAALPEDRTRPLQPVFEFASPVTVKLTPRFTKSGSFPIERIVWDLGDGSPLLTQRRWAPTLEPPFYFSGAIVEDMDDPRNFDIIYTYNRIPGSSFCFYPSITAYSSSTGTHDAAAVTIGPLNYNSFDPTRFKLLQNEITDDGKILMGQVENITAVWKADK